jgi:hypothetical protein
MMMSNADAELAVRRELEKLQLKKPMTPAEVFVFSQDMYLKLEFRSKGDRLSDVRYGLSVGSQRDFRTHLTSDL